ncbi:hypothetical protein HDV63DRAFT_376668 [Trichoderma sp. SZMC 28014]
MRLSKCMYPIVSCWPLLLLCYALLTCNQPIFTIHLPVKKGMGTKPYHEVASLFLFCISFTRQASEGRDTRRGRRCSVEVASRPGLALQLRAGASALLGEGRADTRGRGWI